MHLKITAEKFIFSYLFNCIELIHDNFLTIPVFVNVSLVHIIFNGNQLLFWNVLRNQMQKYVM